MGLSIETVPSRRRARVELRKVIDREPRRRPRAVGVLDRPMERMKNLIIDSIVVKLVLLVSMVEVFGFA